MARLFQKYRRWILGLIVLGAVGFVAIQFVDRFIERFQRSNPPITATVAWDSAETEQLVRTACFDCHSNETVWPWYAYVAPVSWLVTKDVNSGREHLNFSEPQDWTPDFLQHIIDMVGNGEMPLTKYIWLHPDANLSDEQRAQLIAGIEATFNYTAGSAEMDMSPQATPEVTPEP
ncbi:MAG: heme-binding domain-containing protein [Anaerolineae bacterium]